MWITFSNYGRIISTSIFIPNKELFLMELPKVNHWTPDDFKAYLLLYCANADCDPSDEEVMLIKEKSHHHLRKIKDEFDRDSDFERVQKIISGIKHFQYDQDDKNKIINEMVQVFEADGHYDQVEKNILLGLKHIIK